MSVWGLEAEMEHAAQMPGGSSTVAWCCIEDASPTCGSGGARRATGLASRMFFFNVDLGNYIPRGRVRRADDGRVSLPGACCTTSTSLSNLVWLLLRAPPPYCCHGRSVTAATAGVGVTTAVAAPPSSVLSVALAAIDGASQAKLQCM